MAGKMVGGDGPRRRGMSRLMWNRSDGVAASHAGALEDDAAAKGAGRRWGRSVGEGGRHLCPQSPPAIPYRRFPLANYRFRLTIWSS